MSLDQACSTNRKEQEMDALKFKDISTEVSRTYTFPGGETVTIADPLGLNVSESGGHRIEDGAGVAHYIPAGWIHLTWTVKHGPLFSF